MGVEEEELEPRGVIAAADSALNSPPGCSSCGAGAMRVLVVGAGASGLPAFKSALEQGFDAVCLERSAHLGGLWRFKEQPGPGERVVGGRG